MKKIILGLLLLSSMAWAGQPTSDSGPRWFYEQGTDPTCQADRAVVYSKEVAGVSEIFVMSSAPGCLVTQMTSGGIVAGSLAFLGLTATTYDGNDKGSYAAVTAQCVTDTGDVAARGCTDLDIALLVMTGETFGGATDEVWVQDGAPGYTAFSNDCEAWSSVAVDHYGAYWKLSTKIGYLSGCAMSKKYACCK